ncbi:hypothetical protein BT69DRAFT_1277884 [Atractiella rhizophila]|nr:hypothetical protein BT69DRAFT_1280263 [Atractiella rhizophila]KAH8927590.1 hypothetical protein BT69DRAFT_1277884 [Atractiella rhizophila]
MIRRNVLDCPPEVLSLIIEHLLPARFNPPMTGFDDGDSETPNLQRLSLVCKALRELCLPYLFDTAYFQATDHRNTTYSDPTRPHKEHVSILRIKIGDHYTHEHFLRIASMLKDYIRDHNWRECSKLHTLQVALFPNMTENDVVQNAMESIGPIIEENLQHVTTVILETNMMPWSFHFAFSLIQACRTRLRRLEWIDESQAFTEYVKGISSRLSDLILLSEVTFSHLSGESLTEVIHTWGSVGHLRSVVFGSSNRPISSGGEYR